MLLLVVMLMVVDTSSVGVFEGLCLRVSNIVPRLYSIVVYGAILRAVGRVMVDTDKSHLS